MSTRGLPSPAAVSAREALINAAVRFLRHPRVARASSSQQRQFLLQKGLRADEVDEAFYRALSALNTAWRTVGCVSGGGAVSPIFTPLIGQYRWLAVVYDVCRFFLVFVGGGYVIFFVVKHYVIPWLTGRRRSSRRSTLSTDQLQLKLEAVRNQLDEERSTAAQQRQKLIADCSELRTSVHQLNNDLAAVRSLVLGRQQFPCLPAVPPLPDSVCQSVTPSTAASVPLWQLQSVAAAAVTANDQDTGPEDATTVSDSQQDGPAQPSSSSGSSADIVLVSEQNSDELSDS